jgi:hypothetical protein
VRSPSAFGVGRLPTLGGGTRANVEGRFAVYVPPSTRIRKHPASTELAGLFELARSHRHDARLRVIVQIAKTLEAEDDQRLRSKWAGGAPVRIDGDTNAFEQLPGAERRRLMIRVLCELVAYGEEPESTRPARGRLGAGVA